MKKSLKFSLSYSKTKTNAIRVRVTFAGNRYDVAIGCSVKPEYWNNSKERVSEKCPDAFAINNRINRIESELNKLFMNCELNMLPPPSRDMIVRTVSGVSSDNIETETLYDVIERYIRSESVQSSWSQSYISHIKVLKSHVHDFNRKLTISEINPRFITDFISYLYNSGIKNSSTNIYMRMLFIFFHWAEKNGYHIDRNVYSKRPKVKYITDANKELIYLETDELMKLMGMDFNDTELNEIRDMFCFCCFTGLRFSDMTKLKMSDIHDGCIHVVTKKTNKKLSIELNRYSQSIIDRRLWKYQSDTLFENIPIMAYNSGLKQIAKTAGFDEQKRVVYFNGNKRYEVEKPKYELITSHAARRTFVVTSLKLNIAPSVIMKWTGHSDYRTMKPYIEIVDELKQREMRKFDNLI